LLAIVAAVAVIASILSYQYSGSLASQAIAISAQESRSNSEIAAHDLSRVLVNKIENVADNLQIIATSQSVKEGSLERAKGLFESAYASTPEVTDSYFWVDRKGMLVWANAFSDEALYQQYKGADRSQRSYYLEPGQTHEPYVSAVIESVDGVPRLYTAYPILVDGPLGEQSFNGVVVASSNLDQIGEFLRGELSPQMQSSIGLTDRKGTILYSQTESIIGKHVFGPETQSILPDGMKDTFNSIVRDALEGGTGSGDFTYQEATTTISYQPLTIQGNDFGVLYVITPHSLAGETTALIEQQRNAGTITILFIGAVAVGIAFVILSWNTNLKKTVGERTEELRQSNESLKAAVDQLKVHDKLQQEFINIAAHELRTPIQPLLGMAETMRISMKEQEKKTVELSEEEVSMLERNAMRLQRLTQNILDITKIEGNRLSLQKERFDMNDKITNVIKDTARISPEKTSDVEVVAFPNVASELEEGPMIVFTPSSRSLIVDADKIRIFEVLSNLIRNAIKFTKQGRIEIRAYAKDGSALVEISDSGKGIHPEIMPRLFTKFTSKSETGTGLGLYISKNIIEAHGGQMWAHNNDTGGATFSFKLPLVHDQTPTIAEFAAEKALEKN
jgi:signal transduction histidine kinase